MFFIVKIGREIRRVYIKLGRLEDVDEIMRNRSSLKLHGEPLLVTRTLPKTYPLYDRCVTGVKINIQQPINQDVPTAKLNESDLRNYFQKFGSIRYCKWTNDDQTEALFAFMEYECKRKHFDYFQTFVYSILVMIQSIVSSSVILHQ